MLTSMVSLSNTTASTYTAFQCCNHHHKLLQIRASSAAPGVDLKTLESALAKKDSDAVKEALDQLREVGWAKRWSSQPYVSRRTVSLHHKYEVLGLCCSKY